MAFWRRWVASQGELDAQDSARAIARVNGGEGGERLLSPSGDHAVSGITTVWWTCFRYATATSFIRRSS